MSSCLSVGVADWVLDRCDFKDAWTCAHSNAQRKRDSGWAYPVPVEFASLIIR